MYGEHVRLTFTLIVTSDEKSAVIANGTWRATTLRITLIELSIQQTHDELKAKHQDCEWSNVVLHMKTDPPQSDRKYKHYHSGDWIYA